MKFSFLQLFEITLAFAIASAAYRLDGSLSDAAIYFAATLLSVYTLKRQTQSKLQALASRTLVCMIGILTLTNLFLIFDSQDYQTRALYALVAVLALFHLPRSQPREWTSYRRSFNLIFAFLAAATIWWLAGSGTIAWLIHIATVGIHMAMRSPVEPVPAPRVLTAVHATTVCLISAACCLLLMSIPHNTRETLRIAAGTDQYRLSRKPIALLVGAFLAAGILIAQHSIDFPLLYSLESRISLTSPALFYSGGLTSIAFGFWFVHASLSDHGKSMEFAEATKRNSRTWSSILLGISLTAPSLLSFTWAFYQLVTDSFFGLLLFSAWLGESTGLCSLVLFLCGLRYMFSKSEAYQWKPISGPQFILMLGCGILFSVTLAVLSAIMCYYFEAASTLSWHAR